MNMFTAAVYSILLYLFSRTLVWYWTYHHIDWIATREASIKKQEAAFLTKMALWLFEITMMILLSPIIGLTLLNFDNADAAMRSTIQKTSTKIKDPEAAKLYYKIAIGLWDKEASKERGTVE